jgi:two-component system cell cycle sensor histidine kinase/response regulator CckA
LENQKNAPAESDDVPAGTETILVIDDEDALRDVAARMLQGVGYEVVEASSGEEAIKTYGESPGPPDLVITDLGMPGMGGHKAMLELFARYPGTKVIIAYG